MNKVNHLRTLTCLMMIFFLIVSIVTQVLMPSGPCIDHRHNTVSKHSGIGVDEAQFPFAEEKEEENGQDNPSSCAVAFCTENQYLLADFVKTGSFAPFRTPPYISTLPIYLSKRALLI